METGIPSPETLFPEEAVSLDPACRAMLTTANAAVLAANADIDDFLSKLPKEVIGTKDVVHVVPINERMTVILTRPEDEPLYATRIMDGTRLQCPGVSSFPTDTMLTLLGAVTPMADEMLAALPLLETTMMPTPPGAAALGFFGLPLNLPVMTLVRMAFAALVSLVAAVPRDMHDSMEEQITAFLEPLHRDYTKVLLDLPEQETVKDWILTFARLGIFYTHMLWMAAIGVYIGSESFETLNTLAGPMSVSTQSCIDPSTRILAEKFQTACCAYRASKRELASDLTEGDGDALLWSYLELAPEPPAEDLTRLTGPELYAAARVQRLDNAYWCAPTATLHNLQVLRQHSRDIIAARPETVLPPNFVRLLLATVQERLQLTIEEDAAEVADGADAPVPEGDPSE